MEPNKFENQFRKQLNEREIKPSEAAWDRLDAMLSVAEKKKRKFPWVYIAASVLGFLVIGTVCFNGFRTIEINKGTPVVLKQKTDGNNFEEPEIINEGIFPSRIQKTTIKAHKVVADNNNLKKQPKQLENKEEVLIINQSKENDAIVNSSENKNYQSTSIKKNISEEKIL